MAEVEKVSTVMAWELTLRTVSALLKVYDRTFIDKLGIPVTWYDVLVSLSGAPDNRLRAQTLAESVAITRPGMTRLVDAIEKAGLVRREAAKEDRRGSYVVLTDKGELTLAQAHTIHLDDLETNLGRFLDAEDLSDLHRVMNKVWTGHLSLSGRRAMHIETMPAPGPQ
ncbi:MAG: MarR family winged helix-turn-helix transcriptional regulator [Chloroflexi bacterium]|nr:MarR family winged helix-turn-helix transcriptional regulator [Chloroflexota bacterium]MDA1297448.1 MarR family winged helix-turn-helix transcriptional regulator [Chloroflexota bacterium]